CPSGPPVPPPRHSPYPGAVAPASTNYPTGWVEQEEWEANAKPQAEGYRLRFRVRFDTGLSDAHPAGRLLVLLDLAADAPAERVEVLVHLLQQHPGILVEPGSEALAGLTDAGAGDLQTLAVKT